MRREAELERVLTWSSCLHGHVDISLFPCNQNFQDFRSEIEWNGEVPRQAFENLGIPFQCALLDEISEIIETCVFHSRQISVLVFLPNLCSRGWMGKQE